MDTFLINLQLKYLISFFFFYKFRHFSVMLIDNKNIRAFSKNANFIAEKKTNRIFILLNYFLPPFFQTFYEFCQCDVLIIITYHAVTSIA